MKRNPLKNERHKNSNSDNTLKFYIENIFKNERHK